MKNSLKLFFWSVIFIKIWTIFIRILCALTWKKKFGQILKKIYCTGIFNIKFCCSNGFQIWRSVFSSQQNCLFNNLKNEKRDFFFLIDILFNSPAKKLKKDFLIMGNLDIPKEKKEKPNHPKQLCRLKKFSQICK